MTVIRPNSISGINSITANGGDINVFRADGTAGDLVVNNINAGVSTFSGNVSIGGTLTYEDVTNIDSVGIITAQSDIHVTSGNLIIGSTSAEAKLDVTGGVSISSNGVTVTPSGYDLKIRSNTAKLGVHIDSASGTPTLEFGTGNATGGAITTNQATPIVFKPQGSERLRITSNGEIGIGGANYGTSGQFLQSQGSGSAVQWASGGKILQVVQSIKTTTQSFSTGSSTLADSYFDITGLSVSITPASGTKCFVSYTVNVGGQAGYGQGIALLRDSTQIYLGAADGNTIRLSNFDYTVDNKKIETMAGQFLDTHGADGSTAVTYKLQMYVATPGWTSRVNRSQTTSSDRYYGRCASSITVMEVG